MKLSRELSWQDFEKPSHVFNNSPNIWQQNEPSVTDRIPEQSDSGFKMRKKCGEL